MVARAVDPTRLDDHDRRSLGDPLLHEPVREELRLVVVREPVAAGPVVGLVDDRAARVPEDAVRGDVDDATDAGGRVEEVARPLDVDLEHVGLLRLADADPVVGGDVEDGIAATRRLGEPLAGGEVTLGELAAELGEPACLPRRTDEGDDLVAASAQPLDDPSAEKPRPAGDERSHARDSAARGP